MIKVTGYEIEKKENGSEIFKLFFSYEGPSLTVKVIIKDRLFKSLEYGYHSMNLSTGNYWCTYPSDLHIVNQGRQLTTKFNGGVHVKFLKDTDELLAEEDIFFLTTDTEKRKKYEKKNIWIVGDSNVAYLFKKAKDHELEKPSYILNWTSQLSLSLNRFLKSNWKDFIKTIPLKENDEVLFLLGEIDLRVSIIRNAKLKKEDPKKVLRKILNKYLNMLGDFKKEYPFVRLRVLVPPPPLPDGIFHDPVLIEGSEEQRMTLYKIFRETVTETFDETLDCYDFCVDERGFLKKEFLAYNDHHIEDSLLFFEKLHKELSEKP